MHEHSVDLVPTGDSLQNREQAGVGVMELAQSDLTDGCCDHGVYLSWNMEQNRGGDSGGLMAPRGEKQD